MAQFTDAIPTPVYQYTKEHDKSAKNGRKQIRTLSISKEIITFALEFVPL